MKDIDSVTVFPQCPQGSGAQQLLEESRRALGCRRLENQSTKSQGQQADANRLGKGFDEGRALAQDQDTGGKATQCNGRNPG